MSLTTGELVYNFAPVTPAGTAMDDPLTQPLVFPSLEVVTLNYRMPPGPLGHVGWQLGDSAGDIIVPTNGGFIIDDNEEQDWDLYDAIQTGAWTFTAYNTGVYDHTVYLRFFCIPLTSSTTAVPALTVVPNWPFMVA